MISLTEFRALARGGGLVPVWHDVLLDTETAVAAYAKVRRPPFSFLLESAPAGGEQWSRYTFMGTEPRSAWRVTDGVVEDWDPERGWHASRTPGDPLADLEAKLGSAHAVHVPALGRFWNGVVGYFGYDMVRAIERLPHPPPRTLTVPDAVFVFTSAVIIVDNLKAEARIVVAAPTAPGMSEAELTRAYETAVDAVADFERRLRGPAVLSPLVLKRDAPRAAGKSTYARAAFMRDVERIREYIFAGDVFQTLLARRTIVAHDFDTLTLYRALRAVNPSPYMFCLEYDGMALVGSSPELLVRVADDAITVRPIAGTRPRGQNAAEDEAYARDLLADEKERAEHVMLVDLGRNDVGRVASYGSVVVTDFMRVERYSHVVHLVSDVDARLRDGVGAIEALRATFPAGTMTGAPKVRAMEIIDELEPERRGPYAGAVGYIAADRRAMDLCISIRACLIADGDVSVHAGAGIVADSVPEREWEETENKMRAMLTAIGLVRAASAQG
ncbi:MAG TPA: anthranilate synthase component I family protein [Gemmatimonadaceae bacterium]|nr:anthranilate synthase component I family protein [Gemmatimonadaceae bacterium]